MSERPDNPYRKGTALWAVLEGGLQEVYDGLPGWSDLSARQIAEVLGAEKGTVQQALCRICAEADFQVPYARCKPGRKKHE